jgi:DNA ligase-associated metallophosphoesterase
MQIEIRDHHFTLLPQKAILWNEKKTLLISDLHLGKVTHFRREGIAIPSGSLKNNFDRLDELIQNHEVHRIIFLGDLFHNNINAEWDMFTKWRNKYHSVEMLIVLGNHDIIPIHLFKTNNITVYEKDFNDGLFSFTHHPKTVFNDNTYFFCGHLHPVFTLKAKGNQSLRLPCFVIDECQAILPGYGVFTGGYRIENFYGRKIYLIADNIIALARVHASE